jgi:hypothetical protein
MASPSRSAEREEERRLNLRTLVIASAASATAALITSRLWIAGTWIAAAMTPVLVALVSELLHRPTERIVRGRTTDRSALPPSAARQREVRPPERPLPGPGEATPVRIYRSGASTPRPAAGRRKVAFGVVFGTAALAFVIAILAITVPELLAGGSIGKNDGRTTLFSGSKKDRGDRNATTPQDTTTEEQQQPDRERQPTTTEDQPETTPDGETTTTETVPAPQTAPPTETTPTTPTPTTPQQ